MCTLLSGFDWPTIKNIYRHLIPGFTFRALTSTNVFNTRVSEEKVGLNRQQQIGQAFVQYSPFPLSPLWVTLRPPGGSAGLVYNRGRWEKKHREEVGSRASLFTSTARLVD